MHAKHTLYGCHSVRILHVYRSLFALIGVVQTHVSTKAGASSPGMTLFACVRIQVIKEKCVTCVSADR